MASTAIAGDCETALADFHNLLDRQQQTLESYLSLHDRLGQALRDRDGGHIPAYRDAEQSLIDRFLALARVEPEAERSVLRRCPQAASETRRRREAVAALRAAAGEACARSRNLLAARMTAVDREINALRRAVGFRSPFAANPPEILDIST